MWRIEILKTIVYNMYDYPPDCMLRAVKLPFRT